MITERDLDQAIAECQGERNPNASTCIKLAAFYTIRDAMFGGGGQRGHGDNAQPMTPSYSYAAGPAETAIDFYSDSDFSRAIDGRNPSDIWPIMDELMSTIQIVEPRLYSAVMRKLQV